MIPTFDKIHNRFKLNGFHYDFNGLKDVAYSFIKEGIPYEKIIGEFLLDWLSEDDFISVKTSGSTGIPKTIEVQKQAMVNSAIATGDYFSLHPGHTALHCLPTEFIAGKMMFVRAMILGLELDIMEPNSQPLFFTRKPYDFCAMVPFQVQNSLDKLHIIDALIVGGAAVSSTLQEKLQEIDCNVYATYGMTETMSHVAVKRLNGKKEDCYNVLPDVSISQDERDCLVINAPSLSDESIITNDVVELCSNTSFKLIGRYDNVINSGGVKLFPEQIESKLSAHIKKRFFITSEKDTDFGEVAILVLESTDNHFDQSIFDVLDTYETPKKIYNVEKFVETDSGKIQRDQTLVLAK